MQRLPWHTAVTVNTRRYQRRLFSITPVHDKSTAVVDSWGVSSPRGLVSRDEGGYLPESSRAAEDRARHFVGTVWDGERLTRRVKGRKLDQPASSGDVTDPTSTHPADSLFRQKQVSSQLSKGSNTDESPSPTRYEETVKNAMQRILDIHLEPPSPPKTLETPSTSQEQYQRSSDSEAWGDTSGKYQHGKYQHGKFKHGRYKDDETETKLPSKVHVKSRLKTSTLPTIPPTIKAYFDTGHYRLAVFHALNNPHIASNPALLLHISKILSRRGNGKLAARLKSTAAEISRSISGNAKGEDITEKKVRLKGMDSTGRLYDGYWDILLPPGPKPRPAKISDSALSKYKAEEALTRYYNHRLSFLLRQTSLSTHLSPIPSPPSTFRGLRGDTPPLPQASLRQLRRLLFTITRLEKEGFKPDRITANIILRCWLRCAQPPPEPTDPYAYYTKENGEEMMIHKTHSPRVLNGEELMILFKLVSTVMEVNLGYTEDRMRSELGKFDVGYIARIRTEDKWAKKDKSVDSDMDVKSEEGERVVKGSYADIQYISHIKPFAEMMILALRKVRAEEEIFEVIGWKKVMQRRLEVVKEAKRILVLVERRQVKDGQKKKEENKEGQKKKEEQKNEEEHKKRKLE